MGPQAAVLAAILCIIEITFSFDNAIINARVLRTLSPFWQQLFLTVGILIAVFGMRLVFPIALVAITAGCDAVSPFGAFIIGFVAGLLVVLSVEFFDKIARIDDPVGAVSVPVSSTPLTLPTICSV